MIKGIHYATRLTKPSLCGIKFLISVSSGKDSIVGSHTYQERYTIG